MALFLKGPAVIPEACFAVREIFDMKQELIFCLILIFLFSQDPAHICQEQNRHK